MLKDNINESAITGRDKEINAILTQQASQNCLWLAGERGSALPHVLAVLRP